MTAETQQSKRPWGQAIVRGTVLWLIPGLLLLGILWSLVQVGSAFLAQSQQQSEMSARQADYAGTATTIAPEDDTSQNDSGIRLVQFATNTPPVEETSSEEDAVLTNTPQPPEQGGADSAFPTNTPLATETPLPPTAASDAQEPLPERESTPIALPTFYAPQEAAQEQIAGTAVPPRAAVIPRDYELVNIVLLGSDGEITGDNTLRTDTIMIVSINTETESVSMLSLPRDLFVYIPTPTMTRLNTVYGIGEAFDWSGGGFGLLRETIFYNFGIQVHYYALVNISGLEQVVDALGGVDIAVDCAYQDYALVGAEVPEAAVAADDEGLWTLPVGYYHFSGAEALWYARTRGNADDFDRARRQQLLLRAIFRAARDNGQLSSLPNLWGELTQVVETDIPLDVVLGLLPIALNLDESRIQSYSLIRTYHTTPWQPPTGSFAGQYVQLPNAQRISELLFDFYQPPTASRLELASATIAVYNGTSNENWDLVAAERLRSVGLNAYAAGLAETQDYTDSVLIDYAVLSKGSPVPVILEALNISPNQITVDAQAERDVDYAVIIGSNYNSCAGSVVPIE